MSLRGSGYLERARPAPNPGFPASTARLFPCAGTIIYREQRWRTRFRWRRLVPCVVQQSDLSKKSRPDGWHLKATLNHFSSQFKSCCCSWPLSPPRRATLASCVERSSRHCQRRRADTFQMPPGNCTGNDSGRSATNELDRSSRRLWLQCVQSSSRRGTLPSDCPDAAGQFSGRFTDAARQLRGHASDTALLLLGHCSGIAGLRPANCAADSSDAARQLRRNGLGHFPAAARTLLGNGPDTARRLLGKCSGTAAGQSAVATALFDKGMVSSLCRRRMKASDREKFALVRCCRMLRSYHGAVAWGRARESEARLWVAVRRVKVVPPCLPSASTLTRHPAPGSCV